MPRINRLGGTSSGVVPVKRAMIDGLESIELSVDEYERLKKGSDGGILLNVAIGTGSIGATSFASLVTLGMPAKDDPVAPFVIWCVLTIFGVGLGVIFGFLWKNKKGDIDELVKRLEARREAQGDPVPPFRSSRSLPRQGGAAPGSE